jgi:8-oxo-dGTP diphosphatase
MESVVFNQEDGKGSYTYDYERPALTVDVVIYTIKDGDLKVLLIQRNTEPFKEMWAIPGGFVRKGETPEIAAKRELVEETGVKDIYLEQLYTFGDPGRDPRGWVVTISYFALISSDNLKIIANTDAQDVRWFSAYKLPKLAFDHDKILQLALNRLRAKLEYTNVGFQLLPKKFTLTELQRTYEIIYDKELDKRNFRKKILSLDVLNQLEEFRREGNHRPARLYTFQNK